jgi:hypothetical protein
MEIDHGKITFDLNGILGMIGYESVSDIVPSNPVGYANLVFGTVRDRIVNHNPNDENAENILDIIASGNLDDMIEHVNNNACYNLNYSNKESEYDDCYMLYYKNDEMRANIADWMKQNVQSYRSDFGVVTYIATSTEHRTNWPFHLLTSNDRETIAEMPIFVNWVTFEVGSTGEWGVYYEIVEQMIYAGAIEDLYIH